MNCLNKIIIFLIFSCRCCGGVENFNIPNVTFEVLKSGSFRAYIPAIPGISSFGLDVEANQQEFKGSADSVNNDRFIVNFDKNKFRFNKNLKLGDWIFYTIRIRYNGFNYVKERETEVIGLLESYTEPDTLKPRYGELQEIIEDNFNGPVIDNQKWTVEHRIPTYEDGNDNYYFNSYENIKETCYIKDGILYLKPVAREDVEGELDLRDKCTSSDDKQCYYKQKHAYKLPPVKSARITSKQSFKYGKVEIKAKLPRGDWIVPVIQLQSKKTKSIEKSAKLAIAYSTGNDKLCGSGEEDLGSGCLFAGPILSNKINFLVKKCSAISYNNDFHIYKLEWTPDKMTFSIDSTSYGEITKSQSLSEHSDDSKVLDEYFNKEYLLSLGVAVGGLYDFPDHCNSENYPKPWNNTATKYTKSFFDARGAWLKTWNAEDTALKIDYVKVWNK